MNVGREREAWGHLVDAALGPNTTPGASDLLAEVHFYFLQLERERQRFSALLPPPNLCRPMIQETEENDEEEDTEKDHEISQDD